MAFDQVRNLRKLKEALQALIQEVDQDRDLQVEITVSEA